MPKGLPTPWLTFAILVIFVSSGQEVLSAGNQTSAREGNLWRCLKLDSIHLLPGPVLHGHSSSSEADQWKFPSYPQCLVKTP